jgi:hypothetical protein
MKDVDRFFEFVEKCKSEEKSKAHEILKQLVGKQRQLMDIRHAKWTMKLAKLKHQAVKTREERVKLRFEMLNKLSKIPQIQKLKSVEPRVDSRKKPFTIIAPPKDKPAFKNLPEPEVSLEDFLAKYKSATEPVTVAPTKHIPAYSKKQEIAEMYEKAVVNRAKQRVNMGLQEAKIEKDIFDESEQLVFDQTLIDISQLRLEKARKKPKRPVEEISKPKEFTLVTAVKPTTFEIKRRASSVTQVKRRVKDVQAEEECELVSHPKYQQPWTHISLAAVADFAHTIVAKSEPCNLKVKFWNTQC